MSQPIWKCIAQLGDKNPLDYGGKWLFVDTAVDHPYPPEVEVLEVPDEGDGNRTIYRYILEPCTWIDGVLSNNEFHPNHPAWFAKDIGGVASTTGMTQEELVELLCSDDPIQRAHGYDAVVSYFGIDEFDQYPIQLTLDEVRLRYNDPLYTVCPPATQFDI